MNASQMSNEEKKLTVEENTGNQLPDVGKISPEIFDELIYPNQNVFLVLSSSFNL